ncbi:MAG: GNAT family N-acetyltransferase [Actinomycetes bacterium]
MTDTSTVRPARPGEAPAVRALVAAAGLPTAGLDEVWATLVATLAGRPVGVAAIERHGPPEAPVFLLRSVVVEDARRGSGLGAALVTAALAAADREVGAAATIGLLTETADGYFDRFGFTRVDRGDLPRELGASPELTGACPDSARAYLRRPPEAPR